MKRKEKRGEEVFKRNTYNLAHIILIGYEYRNLAKNI